jgi:hypothetical protein
MRFSQEARALQTPFRIGVLRTIYRAVRDETGKELRSASVSTWSQPGEPDSATLLLSILADVDRNRSGSLRRKALNEIAREASSWTEEERRDYAQTIDFEVEPFQV